MSKAFVSRTLLASAALGAALLAAPAMAILPAGHVTDGVFTDGTEWTGTHASKSFFPVVGNAGGAYLYVEQGNNSAFLADTLYLMYDYVNGTAGSTNSFFDVFFEIPDDNSDYLIRISNGNTFAGYESPSASPAASPATVRSTSRARRGSRCRPMTSRSRASRSR